MKLKTSNDQRALQHGFGLGKNNLGEDDFQSLAEIEDEDDFIDAIRGHIQDFLAIGTVKAFRVKDLSGKLVCEYDDEFWG